LGVILTAPSPCRECKSGAGLWEVLQLEKSYNLDEHLKSPKVRAAFKQSFWKQRRDAGALLGLLGWRCQAPSIPISSLQYTANFQKRLGDFMAQLGDVRLLRSEGRNDLETFARSGVDEVDYRRFQEEVRGCWQRPGSSDSGLPKAGFQAADDSVFL